MLLHLREDALEGDLAAQDDVAREVHRAHGALAEHAEHLVYSDGLATVSVYVEKLMDGTRSYTGLSNMGAMNAYGTVIDGHQVTVVGEVPAATVQSMAQSVVRQQ